MVFRATAIAVLCLAIRATGQPNERRPAADQPCLRVQERVVDLGRMLQGEKETAAFVLTNRGDGPLNISSVRATCGCTVPRKLSPDEKLLEPGESIRIEVLFNTQGRMGKQRKSVTVFTNDPIEPRLQLFLTAEIVTLTEVLVDGRALRILPLGKVRPGEPVEKMIEILPTEPGKELEILSVDIKSDVLTHKLEPIAKDDRKGSLLKLAVVPDAVPGPLSAEVQISGKIGEDAANLLLRANGEVAGELRFTPLQIKQTSPLIHGGKMAPVRIRSEIGRPFDILGAQAGPNLAVAVTPVEGRVEYLLELKIKESAPPGPFGVYLDIHTTSVMQPLIQIPVFGNVRPYIDAYPPAVFLVQDDGGKRSARVVKLETATRKPFQVTGVSVDSSYVTAGVTEPPGRQLRGVQHIRVELDGHAPPGVHEAAVRIETDVKAAPNLTIPVTFQAI